MIFLSSVKQATHSSLTVFVLPDKSCMLCTVLSTQNGGSNTVLFRLTKQGSHSRLQPNETPNVEHSQTLIEYQNMQVMGRYLAHVQCDTVNVTTCKGEHTYYDQQPKTWCNFFISL